MANGWQEVPLKVVAKPISRAVPVEAGKAYRTIGVKWWGMGAYERETIDGSRTAAKTLSIVREGDLIINKIWVRHGSVAIAGKDVDGCAGSGEFPTFELDLNRIDSRWLHWQTKMRSFWEKCDNLSRGTSGKNRIKPELFLTINIPLPPLTEQRRIAEGIESLAARVQEAQRLREETDIESDVFWKRSLASVFLPNPNIQETVEDACEAMIDNLHSTPRYDGNKFLCVRSQDIGWGDINYSTMLKTSEAEFQERTRRGEPQKGDIVFVREGDIGRCAVLDGSHKLSLGQRVMMLRPDTSKIISHYLMYQLMSEQVLDAQLLEGKKGTTSHHLNISHFRKARINVPPLDEQRRIVAYLDGLQAKVNTLRELQAESAKELSALMPSILDKAFKGEL
jgi:type I restriction enzyme, S subunit